MWRRRSKWTCAWVSPTTLATGGKRMGRQTIRFDQVGIGDVHAVPVDGDRGTALCGQLVRVSGSTPWPPSFGDNCLECERLAT